MTPGPHPVPGPADPPGVRARCLSSRQRWLKRAFDIAVAAFTLLVFGWLILLGAVVSALAHGGSGFFVQRRVGRHGRLFPLLKLRTMRASPPSATTVTTALDLRITRAGRLLRKSKLDELPQFVNVLLGHMSLVGPRPDVPGFADRLSGADRVVLCVRPGITGPATLAYRHEETLLASQDDPERFNREVVYPHKVRLNRAYIENYAFRDDLVLLWRTLTGG